MFSEKSTSDFAAASLFQTLWNSPSQAMATIDFEEKTRANEAFLRLFRFSEHETAPALLPFFVGENIHLLHKVWAGKLNGFETEIVVSTDRVVRLQILAAAQNQALVLAADVTETHVFQEELLERLAELEQKNTELNRYIEAGLQLENFAWIASHDLKEPVRTIGNFSQLLERRYSDRLDDTGREFLGFIRTAVGNMSALIEDLLEYSKTCQSDFFFEEINPESLILFEKSKLERLFADLRWTLEIEADLPEMLLASKPKFGQIFFHLMQNALKFRQKDREPRLEIGFSETDLTYIFWIKDNGIGIQPEFFERVFLLFKRLHARQVFPGSGIGLAVCKKVAEQHGGRVWVESEFGVGSTFFFSISKKLKVSEPNGIG